MSNYTGYQLSYNVYMFKANFLCAREINVLTVRYGDARSVNKGTKCLKEAKHHGIYRIAFPETVFNYFINIPDIVSLNCHCLFRTGNSK